MKATMPRVDGDEDIPDASDVDLDDSEDGGFDFGADDDSSDNGDDSSEDEQDAAEEDEAVEGQDEDEDEEIDDEDDLGFAEGSDAEDLLDLDAELPAGLVPVHGPESDQEQDAWGGIDTTSASKKRSANGESRSAKRRKLRSLPTFASADDYAALIDGTPEDNV
jgi:ribosome biogenesis protein MAK21